MNKVHKVMSEFKNKTLKSSSGAKVTSRAQAIAIALSEKKRSEDKVFIKRMKERNTR